jgi:hypothetical protein
VGFFFCQYCNKLGVVDEREMDMIDWQQASAYYNLNKSGIQKIKKAQIFQNLPRPTKPWHKNKTSCLFNPDSNFKKTNL